MSVEELVDLFVKLEKECKVRYYEIERWSTEIWSRLEDLSRVGREYFQIFDPLKTPTERILLFSLARVLRAFKNHTNIARDPNIELLLRLSGTRDIKKAMKILGVRENEKGVLSVIVCDNESLSRDIGFPELAVDQETRVKWLENLSKTLNVNISVCNRYSDSDSRIMCIEKSILSKTSLIE
ncbi:MAG: KEOPS complex subunit Cgi121 [Sulfolobales archaeon]